MFHSGLLGNVHDTYISLENQEVKTIGCHVLLHIRTMEGISLLKCGFKENICFLFIFNFNNEDWNK